MKRAFLRRSVEAIFAKPREDFANMLLMSEHVLRVDEDVVEIDNNAYIEHIGEYIVHESLKGSGSIRETERHYEPFVRAIASAKSCFPLVSFRDSNEMICMFQVYFRVDLGSLWCI
jgi:hypothetical protein